MKDSFDEALNLALLFAKSPEHLATFIGVRRNTIYRWLLHTVKPTSANKAKIFAYILSVKERGVS